MLNILLLIILCFIVVSFLIYNKKEPVIRKCKDCKYFVEVSSGCSIKYMTQQSTNDYKICNYSDKEFKKISFQTDKLRNT